MTKFNLVVELKRDTCDACPVRQIAWWADDTFYCGAAPSSQKDDEVFTLRPDWCPLKETP